MHYPARDTSALIAVLMAQAAEMSAVRPSMAPIYNLLARWRHELEGLHGLDLATARRRAANAAAAVATASHDAVRQVALRARALIYVCCESFKQRQLGMPLFDLEEMDPSEPVVRGLPDVKVRNIYFDVTPPGLITGWVNETGVTSPQD